jgi:hypothetical protein
VSIMCAGTQTRVVVVPKPLAGFFCERLDRLYAGRPDVQVVVDRRIAQRRRAAGAPPRHAPERRRADRRADAVSWSLKDMPFAATE